MKLLTREEFKKFVLERDKNKCVFCKNEANVVHHIIERKLWDDGGYYIDNGVTLCEDDHWAAERTIITCERLRELAGIKNVLFPKNFEKLSENQVYDKWGNIVVNGEKRIPGPLFTSDQVQKVLKHIIYLFEEKNENI